MFEKSSNVKISLCIPKIFLVVKFLINTNGTSKNNSTSMYHSKRKIKNINLYITDNLVLDGKIYSMLLNLKCYPDSGMSVGFWYGSDRVTFIYFQVFRYIWTVGPPYPCPWDMCQSLVLQGK